MVKKEKQFFLHTPVPKDPVDGKVLLGKLGVKEVLIR